MFGKNTTGDPIIHWGTKEATLNIGNYCTIGKNVNIYLSGGSIITKNNKWIIPLSSCSCSITIGNDVWIGNNVTILPGITIGDGSNIANNSYITSDVKPYSFIYGKPAQVIKYKFNIGKKIIYPDHHKLTNIDLKQLIDKAKKENLVLVTTEKDFFRLNKSQRKNIKFLKIKLEIKDKKNLEKILISKL